MAEFITIKFHTGNAAFEDSPTGEIARILRSLADTFASDGIPSHYIRDINGNTCGDIEIITVDD